MKHPIIPVGLFLLVLFVGLRQLPEHRAARPASPMGMGNAEDRAALAGEAAQQLHQARL